MFCPYVSKLCRTETACQAFVLDKGFTNTRQTGYARLVSKTGQVSGGYHFGAVSLFVLLHLAVVAVLFVPATPHLLMWLAATYSLRPFGGTAGEHTHFLNKI